MANEENNNEAGSNAAAETEVNTNNTNTAANMLNPGKMGILNDIKIALTIEIGRTSLKIKDLLNLTKDSVIDLNKNAGEPVDIYANGKLISKGTIITVNGKYCAQKLTSMPDIK